MNKTSRTDEPLEGEGHNQSPNAFSNDLVTNQDLNGIVNDREQRGRDPRSTRDSGQLEIEERPAMFDEDLPSTSADKLALKKGPVGTGQLPAEGRQGGSLSPPSSDLADFVAGATNDPKPALAKLRHVFATFGKFIGPGFLVSVAYSRWPFRACTPPDSRPVLNIIALSFWQWMGRRRDSSQFWANMNYHS